MGTSIRNVQISVGTSFVLISEEIAAPFIREAISLTNVSAGGEVISLSWGQEAVAGQGVVLYPTGNWSESIDNRFTPSNLRLYAICSGAGGLLAVHERIRG